MMLMSLVSTDALTVATEYMQIFVTECLRRANEQAAADEATQIDAVNRQMCIYLHDAER